MKVPFLQRKAFFLTFFSVLTTTLTQAQLKLNVKNDSIYLANASGKTLFAVDNAGRVKIDSTADGTSDSYVLTWDPALRQVKKILKSTIAGSAYSLQQSTDVGNTTTNNLTVSRSQANTWIGIISNSLSNSSSAGFSANSNAGSLTLQSNGTLLFGGGINEEKSGQQLLRATNSLYFKAVDFRFYDGKVAINKGNSTPLATLHVGGQVKIDTITTGMNTDSVLVVNNGVIKRVLQSSLGGGGGLYTFSTGFTNASGTITNNLSTGVSGGQSVVGGTASGNNLTLSSTTNATKGKILIGSSGYDETGNKLGIGTQTPEQKLHVKGQVKIDTLTTGSGTDSNLVVNNGIIKKVAAEEGTVVLAKGTVTNAASLDIDMSSYYNLYDIIEIKLFSARPATNAALLLCRLSPDASIYTSTGYKWNINAVVGSAAAGVDDVSASNNTSIQIAGACSNVTERTASGTVTLNNPGVSTFFPMVQFTSSRYNNTPAVSTNQGTGLITTAQLTKAIRFYFSTGNISTLSYKVIGYKN